ncbi:MAG: LmeA family phospholipid-binding protein [Chlorobia bacterium]|nr:LmeA family phospholipid-binding protein [Fimbriimonadaceae bacterium]
MVPFEPVEQPQSLDVGQVEVILQDLALPMGLVINGVTLHAKQIHLEKEPFKVQAPEPGTLEALVLAPNLADFLNKQAPGGLKDFKVELRDGKIHIQASIMIMKAVAVCTLRIQDETKLFVDLESVDVMGVGAKNMVQSQLDKINPVLDAADLPIEARLTGYEIADGRLIIRGTIYPTLK